jgi:hypothetical protein
MTGLLLPLLIAFDLFGEGKPLMPNIVITVSKFGVMHAFRALETLGGFRTTLFRFRHSTPRAATSLSTCMARCGSPEKPATFKGYRGTVDVAV